MSIIVKPYTFSAGAVIIAAEHNANFNTIYNDYNGGITNSNISGTAAIVDTKLAQIVTFGKVNGTAITGLTNLASGAGVIPIANLPFGASSHQGDVYYDNGTVAFTRLTPGTSGQVLKTNGNSANPSWAGIFSTILDYGSSASASTARQAPDLKVAFGAVAVSGANHVDLSNLPFTSSSSFYILGTFGTATDASEAVVITRTSGSAATIYNNDNQNQTISWFAIGT